MGSPRSRLRDERGTVLVWVGASMVALCAITALAVDYGMLTTARTEAQRAADAAALAGAGSLISAPADEDRARAWAAEWAALNPVRGMAPVVLPEDVDVLLDEAKVRVRVRLETSRGTALPTYFARVFGVDAVDVSTTAAAEAYPAGTSYDGEPGECMLPVALIDKWADDGDGVWGPGDTYDPAQGFGEDDYGDVIRLKLANEGEGGGGGPAWCGDPNGIDGDPAQPILDVCSTFEESWHCWYLEAPSDEGGGGGTDVLGPRIYPGTDCGPTLSVGDDIWEASGAGNKQSLVTDQFRQLIESDPDVHWDPAANEGYGCVVRGSSTECLDEDDTGRIRRVPIANPETIGPGSGANNEGTIADFTGVFVDRVSCTYDAGDFAGPEGRWNVYIRLVRAGGEDPVDDGGDGMGTLLRLLRLVE